MKNEKPDNIVFSDQEGYNASLLPYATNVGAPTIKTEDVVAWKTRGIHQVNKEFENKFNELKQHYKNLMEEYEWNDMVYNAKFSFEPVIGEIYHLYTADDGHHFLSLIGPTEWNKEHIATFKLNSDKKWIKLEPNERVTQNSKFW
ncbi:DUF2452 domain-containing protein [Flavobacterium franklandianum]|uniref:DUF2452 domain-containing protein n=1 Tax=Flavobacterium franklandianum TaxID=2594430 RepID=UPI00117A70F3|nr:DUF2452 domain-containing protein [Flavobacterium franklandianum]TRX21864.1 DUF2452 domain-containing protein [Flavobacterium franklandianum]